MRAIIIEEERFTEVAELMRFKAMELAERTRPEGVTEGQWQQAVQDIHRSMHYHFVRWAQSHGASCIK